MAINIILEKQGFQKRAFVGFSYTTYFFASFVPIVRLDIKGFFIISIIWIFTSGLGYISNYLPINLKNNPVIINFFKSLLDMKLKYLLTIFIVIMLSIYLVTTFIWILVGNWYNRYYTRKLLKDGYLPAENDEYTLALLKEYKHLEYTEKEIEDSEKMNLYKNIVKNAKSEEKIKLSFFIVYLLFFPIIFTLVFYILRNYAPDLTVLEFLEKFDMNTNF